MTIQLLHSFAQTTYFINCSTGGFDNHQANFVWKLSKFYIGLQFSSADIFKNGLWGIPGSNNKLVRILKNKNCYKTFLYIKT